MAMNEGNIFKKSMHKVLFSETWQSITTSFSFLTKRDKRIIIFISMSQALLTFLDIIAVALIGVIGSLSIRGIQSRGPGNRVDQVLGILGIENFQLQTQVAIVAFLAVFFFVIKTVISIIVTTRTLRFLSSRSASLSSVILENLFSYNITQIRKLSTQEILFATSSGTNAVMMGIVASVVNGVSDITLLVGLTAVLFVVDPITTLLSIFLFSVVSFLMYQMLHEKADRLGRESTKLSVESNTLVLELINSYREFLVRNRRFSALAKIRDKRFKLAGISAQQSFIPNVSKYVMESLLITGTFCLCIFQFATNDAGRAVGVITIFLAAGTRIAPAFLRIQQGALSFRISLGVSRKTIQLLEESKGGLRAETDERNLITEHIDFIGELKLQNVSYTYPHASHETLIEVQVEIDQNEKLAVVGPSGSGKSTLADLILGVISPSKGQVLISGVPPIVAIRKWPGAIGYVPQEIFLSAGSIKENICLGFDAEAISDSLVWEALDSAQLGNFVRSLPSGLSTLVGDGFQGLSGGQRQRIGIARAILSKPRLLLLDEATSSLDLDMEEELIMSLERISKEMTLVIITHRTNILRLANTVLHLNRGVITK